MNVQGLVNDGKGYILLVFGAQENNGSYLLFDPPCWYASETKEGCEEVYNSVKTESTRALVYSLALYAEYPNAHALLPVEVAFQPEKIEGSLCCLLDPMKASEMDSLLSNTLVKEIAAVAKSANAPDLKSDG